MRFSRVMTRFVRFEPDCEKLTIFRNTALKKKLGVKEERKQGGQIPGSNPVQSERAAPFDGDRDPAQANLCQSQDPPG